MASNRQNRITEVKRLLLDYEDVDVAFVQERLGCGLGQAKDALRRATYALAAENHAMTTPHVSNGWTAACDGPALPRHQSRRTRLKDLKTRTHNVGVLVRGSARSPVADAQDRRLGRKAAAFEAAEAAYLDAGEDLTEAIEEVLAATA